MLVLMGFSAVVLLFPPPPSLRHRAQCSHLLHPPQANCPDQLPQDLTSSGLRSLCCHAEQSSLAPFQSATPSSLEPQVSNCQALSVTFVIKLLHAAPRCPRTQLSSFCTRKAFKKSRHLSNEEETLKSFKPSSLKLLNLKSSSLPQAPAHFKTPLLGNNAPPFCAVLSATYRIVFYATACQSGRAGRPAPRLGLMVGTGLGSQDFVLGHSAHSTSGGCTHDGGGGVGAARLMGFDKRQLSLIKPIA
ncbi:hypothetical protein C8J57DRAFT_1478852 [Mycena rebaudengoi]|nr:hypothetical protein C8J57DRAFT_1478852 [Mycena rebaudengoi]